MKPRKKGQQYEICYRCPGYEKPIYERFPTKEAANVRCAEIELLRSRGELRPPKRVEKTKPNYMTVAQLMDEYVQLYGLNHWGDSYLSYSRHRIEHYIKPFLGDTILQTLTTHDLDVFYSQLQETPAIVLKGHTDTGKTVSTDVIKKVHDLLRSALNQAVAWEYIPSNPAEKATLPRHKPKRREVWSAEEAKTALDLCEDGILKQAMLLAIGCSMRVGEILGLTWDCVDITPESIASGCASVFVNKEIKRCDKRSLEDLEKRGHSDVILTFPAMKQAGSVTSLVLKAPKTESSVRRIFLPGTVADALLATRESQDSLKSLLGDEYQDFNLVLAHENGRPYEERQIAQKLRAFIQANDLPPVVFHSLRHCSTSIKLEISNGNIKAVQGDTGHAQARMVTDVYAHTHDDVRRNLARKVEEDFFRREAVESKEKSPVARESGTESAVGANASREPDSVTPHVSDHASGNPGHPDSPEDSLASVAFRYLQENPQFAQLVIAAAQISPLK